MVQERDFIFKVDKALLPDSGSFTWKSPSNIALVKYWGKSDPQIPKNASISFTLSNCFTQTTLNFTKKKSEKNSLEIIFEGKKKESFKPKIETFFKRIEKFVPFIKAYDFEIQTENSFPHSSGIASSASGMSALSLCLLSLEKLIDPTIKVDFFNQKASFLARLGSGSACRSIEGEMVVWGKHPKIKHSSDLYGIKPGSKIHPVFHQFQDTILLVDKGQKEVSSTVGHNLMHDHPFAEERFKQANNNLGRLMKVLETGNLEAFISIVEHEALSLHAMMMTSNPYFMLMKPNTLKIIENIWEYRKHTGIPVCFTLDAGANVHVLYPEQSSQKVKNFIEETLAAFCENHHFIHDHSGNGAIQIE